MAEQTDTTSFSSDEGDSNISYYQPISDCPSGEEQDEDSGEGFTYHPSTPANVEFDVDALVQQKLGIVDTPPTLNASVGPLDPEKERTLNKVALDEFDNRYKTQVEASIPSSSGANIHKLFNSFGELSAGQRSALEDIAPVLASLNLDEFHEIFGTINTRSEKK